MSNLFVNEFLNFSEGSYITNINNSFVSGHMLEDHVAWYQLLHNRLETSDFDPVKRIETCLQKDMLYFNLL